MLYRTVTKNTVTTNNITKKLNDKMRQGETHNYIIAAYSIKPYSPLVMLL